MPPPARGCPNEVGRGSVEIAACLLYPLLFVEKFEFVDVEGAADAAGEVVTEVGCAG